jgi:hypothetical protein
VRPGPAPKSKNKKVRIFTCKTINSSTNTDSGPQSKHDLNLHLDSLSPYEISQKLLIEKLLEMEQVQKDLPVQRLKVEKEECKKNVQVEDRENNKDILKPIMIICCLSLLIISRIYSVDLVCVILGFILMYYVSTFFELNVFEILELVWTVPLNEWSVAIYDKKLPKKHIKESDKVKTETKVTVSKDNLLKGDPYYKQRGTILDLRTKNEKEATHINFKCLVKIENKNVVLAEIDSDSHVSLLTEHYYNQHLKGQCDEKFLKEDKPTFKGMGGTWLISKYPPLALNFQLGSCLLSGRFVITSELNSSVVLIGSDIIFKYGISLVAFTNGTWKVQVGYEPKSLIPCIVTHKAEIHQENKKMNLGTSETFENDSELQLIETGIVIHKNKPEIENELQFVKNHKKIPPHFKEQIIEHLRKMPNLYSGNEFSEIPVPSTVYEHDVEFIDEKTCILDAKPYKIAGIRSEQLKDCLLDMVENNILVSGDSSTVSPVFFVSKKAGANETAEKGRLVFDYRKLNNQIKAKHFPLTSIKTFFDEAANYKFFSVIDVRNAFLSVGLTERAKKACGITTPHGVFIPQRMPFGLKTAPSGFCFVMNKILSGLPAVSFYMDDILVCGQTEEEMTKNLLAVFDRLHENNLKIQISKIKFFEDELKMLGVIFSRQGKKIDKSKISSICNFPEIKTIKQCQQFLGMLNFLSSFIPHFATRMYPVYCLLRKANQQNFVMTVEAQKSIDEVKEFLKKDTICYNPDFSQPFYLSVDASQVGVGALLYQVKIYERTNEGEKRMMSDFGFLPEKNLEHFMLPGVSPGRNTPVVKAFLKNEESLNIGNNSEILKETLNPEKTMTEKIKFLEDKVIIVKPISWFSKTFTQSQVERYQAMEKEFLGILMATLNFREYLESSPLTYILSDSQSVLWALCHQGDSLKISRHLMKLWEVNWNLICVHLEGTKNAVADFLSRMYLVEDKKSKNEIGPKMAQHINSPFPLLSVISKDNIIEAFKENPTIMEKCEKENCSKNVNEKLFRGLGPFNYEGTPIKKELKVNKISRVMENFGLTQESLTKFLTYESLIKHQNEDEDIQNILEFLKSNPINNRGYFLEGGLLKRKFENENLPVTIVVPRELVPFVLAHYHLLGHSGAKKLNELIKTKYFWKNMVKDTQQFSRGCCLCSIYKHSTLGKSEVGVPKKILEPKQAWQIDICQGLPPTKNSSSFLTMVDIYSGYVVATPLRKETSEEIAKILEENIFKIFGPPTELSSDNAANLNGPEIKRLLKFYNVKRSLTTPYSPESHGLVENCNRYITELVRILSDQFQTPWLDVISLASIMMNSIPRKSLLNHSPFFIMFNNEAFYPNRISENFLDIEHHVLENTNNKMFAKLFIEYQIQKRIKQNESLKRKSASYPSGTLIYAKDFSKQPNKKVKPVYLKTPEKVITEYKTLVYSMDIFGKIQKRAKNNIKICYERSIELFGALPINIQVLLGAPLNKESWDEILKSDKIPEYLKSTEIEVEPRQLRQNLGIDTHLLEWGRSETNEHDDAEVGAEAELELDDTDLSDRWVHHLQDLHKLKKLNNINLNIEDINKNLKTQEYAKKQGILKENVLESRLRPRRVRFANTD